MVINVWMAVVIAVIAMFLGIWIGRNTEGMAKETELMVSTGMSNQDETGGNGNNGENNSQKHPQSDTAPVDAIVSPAAGEVAPFHEGRRRGVCIKPQQGRIFAPVSGKVKRLYPMGNSMLIISEKGEEILIKVCDGVDEIFSMYFRSRVVQNEMINKGKLLLEFDKEGLEAQGVEVLVTVCAEDREGSVFAMTGNSPVKAGEALLWA